MMRRTATSWDGAMGRICALALGVCLLYVATSEFFYMQKYAHCLADESTLAIDEENHCEY